MVILGRIVRILVVILDRMCLSEMSVTGNQGKQRELVTEISFFTLIIALVDMVHVSDRRSGGRVRSGMVANRSSRSVAVVVIAWRVGAISLHFKVARRSVNLILTIDLLAKCDSLHSCKHKCCLKKLHFVKMLDRVIIINLFAKYL